MTSSRYSWRLVLPLLLLPWLVNSRKNVTIDETSSAINYVPRSSWSQVTGDLDAGGGHMLTDDAAAYADITFTFVSFYFMSTTWPYRVSTLLTIDGGEAITVDLQDHSVPDTGSGGGITQSAIMATYTGEESKTRTIRVSVLPGDKYAVLDRFIFEVEDETTPTPSASSTSSPLPVSKTTTTKPTQTSNPASSSKETPNTTRTLAIILGILGPVIAILALLLIWFCCFRRRRQNHPGDHGMSTYPEKPLFDPAGPYAYPYSSVPASHAHSHSMSMNQTLTPNQSGYYNDASEAAISIPPRLVTPSPTPMPYAQALGYLHEASYRDGSDNGSRSGYGYGAAAVGAGSSDGRATPVADPWVPYIPSPAPAAASPSVYSTSSFTPSAVGPASKPALTSATGIYAASSSVAAGTSAGGVGPPPSYVAAGWRPHMEDGEKEKGPSKF